MNKDCSRFRFQGDAAFRFVPLMAAGLFVSTHLWSTQVAWAQKEWEDWPRYEALEKSLAETKKSNPAEAVAKYQAFWRSNVQMHPISGATTFVSLAQVQHHELKQPQEALKSLDAGLGVYGDSPAAVILLKEKAETLRGMKRFEEAGALAEQWWPQLREAARSDHTHLRVLSSLALHQMVVALEEQIPGMADKSAHRGEPGEKDDQAGLVWKADEMTSHPARAQWVKVLQRAIVEVPLYLDDRKQGADGGWFAGWMYRHLMIGLIGEGRAEEALGWGRLYWSMSAFDEEALKDASRLLGRAWMSLGKTRDVLSFVRAQGKGAEAEAIAANPLLKVKLPKLEGKALAYVRERWLQKVQGLVQAQLGGQVTGEDGEFINLGLLQALTAQTDKERNEALEQTMLVAEARFKSALQTQPEDKGIGREVARVLKAADGNTTKAQAFINYVEGKGTNPLTGFYREVRGEVTSADDDKVSTEKVKTDGKPEFTIPKTQTKPATKTVGVRP